MVNKLINNYLINLTVWVLPKYQSQQLVWSYLDVHDLLGGVKIDSILLSFTSVISKIGCNYVICQ